MPTVKETFDAIASRFRTDKAAGTNAVAFLCSERARYITGAVLTVTGGMDLFTF